MIHLDQQTNNQKQMKKDLQTALRAGIVKLATVTVVRSGDKIDIVVSYSEYEIKGDLCIYPTDRSSIEEINDFIYKLKMLLAEDIVSDYLPKKNK